MRKVLAILGLLFFAICAVGQTAPQTPTALAGPPVMAGPMVALPATGGLVVQGGYATTFGSSYPPLVTTPAANLSILSPNPVGATNATSNLQVGATNSTVDSVTQPVPAVQPSVEISPSWAAPAEMASAETTAEASSSGGPTDLGAAKFDVVNERAPGETRSLGDVVRELREQPKPAATRTFTNSDLQNLKDHEPPASQNPR